MRRSAAVLIGAAWLGCGGPTPERERCPSEAELRSTVDAVKSSTLAHWQPPTGMRGAHAVLIEFKLSPDGRVAAHRTQAEDPEIARSTEQAFLAAQPFAVPRTSQACLARTPLRARFYLTADGR